MMIRWWGLRRVRRNLVAVLLRMLWRLVLIMRIRLRRLNLVLLCRVRLIIVLDARLLSGRRVLLKVMWILILTSLVSVRVRVRLRVS